MKNFVAAIGVALLAACAPKPPAGNVQGFCEASRGDRNILATGADELPDRLAPAAARLVGKSDVLCEGLP